MDEKFLKPYNPANTESRIYQMWEESGYFNPDNLPLLTVNRQKIARTKPFTIVMPPPNANGNLHAGHALFITVEDILTRYKRMQGFSAVWLPGADHAGFETQVVYEKKLEKEGRSRFQMDPADLYKEILAFTLENKLNMESQVRALGASCDWSREKFTLDLDVIEQVQKTFIKMHDDGLVYRGKRTVNWCSKHQTSLSDIETDSVEETTPFYTFKYGPFDIGTVRPETKFGDKYVVMHPDDPRYADWKDGQTFDLEWINGPITATVIKDEAIDMEFGTGVMTITPWHSQVDFEIAKRHGLDMEQIIDLRGKLLPIAGEFEGMRINEARPKLVEKLAAKGLLVSADAGYENVVKKCYKCGTIIEPQVKDQWFVSMQPLAKLALEAVDNQEVTFLPEHEEKVFRHWMENTVDWNISRQIIWGISIPAWFRNQGSENEEVRASIEKPEGEGWVKDTDTFDTWFSSGQWPLITTGFRHGEPLPARYPTDVLETGRDIIFFWVARMIIFGLYLGKKVPFHTVYLHGLVNDANGKKMSKSKGNVINPLDLTEKFGTDALRMSLIVGNTPGTDLALREEKVKGYKNFANKLWNIARYILEASEPFAGSVTAAIAPDALTLLNEHDQRIVDEFSVLAADITLDMDEYRLYLAADKIYHYIWHRLADELIEESKLIFGTVNSIVIPSDTFNDFLENPASIFTAAQRTPENDSSEAATRISRAVLLRHLLRQCLIVLHPFMPFVTEEIWQSLPETSGMLMVAEWPSAL